MKVQLIEFENELTPEQQEQARKYYRVFRG